MSKTVPGFRMLPPLTHWTDPAEELYIRVLAPLKESKAPPLPVNAVAHCILVDSLDESLVVDESRSSLLVVFCLHFCLISNLC